MIIPYTPTTVVRLLKAQEAMKKAEGKGAVTLLDHLAAIRSAKKVVTPPKQQPIKANLL